MGIDNFALQKFHRVSRSSQQPLQSEQILNLRGKSDDEVHHLVISTGGDQFGRRYCVLRLRDCGPVLCDEPDAIHADCIDDS